MRVRAWPISALQLFGFLVAALLIETLLPLAFQHDFHRFQRFGVHAVHARLLTELAGLVAELGNVEGAGLAAAFQLQALLTEALGFRAVAARQAADPPPIAPQTSTR